MEMEMAITDRRAYWLGLAEKVSQVHVTDFEIGVLLGMSTKFDLVRSADQTQLPEKKNA